MMFNSTASTLFEQLPILPTSVVLHEVPMVFQESGRLLASMTLSWQTIWECLTISMLWKTVLVIHLAANFKHVPFIYHLRVLNAIRFVLRSQRPAKDVRPEQLFQPIITSSTAPLVEIDVFGHKSNSTYFADVDVARTHLVTTLFGNGIFKFRGSTTMNGLSGKKTSKLTLALGAVSCSFRKELLPYETYDMYTRVLTWDDKWFYLVTHFVKKSANIRPSENTLYPHQNSSVSQKPSGRSSDSGTDETSKSRDTRSPITASALSKVVFKDGRKTLSPNYILELSNLLPSRPNAEKQAETDKTGAEDRQSERADCDDESDWTWAKMEAERIRGLSKVQHLADQAALEQEFTPDVALGRHYDGYGIEGVVSTLAQLGRLSSYQLV